MKFYDSRGIARDTEHLHIVEGLEKIKSASGSNPWPVINKIIELWQQKSPTEWKAHIIHVENVKKTRKDGTYASTYDKANNAYLRYTLDIPEFVMKAIRFMYSDEELPMNRTFFNHFAKRYPIFKVAERL